MADARRPWYATATPEMRSSLQSAAWRRTAEAALFRADNDTALPGTMSEVVQSYEAEAEQNPMAPRPKKQSRLGRAGSALKGLGGGLVDAVGDAGQSLSGFAGQVVEDVSSTPRILNALPRAPFSADARADLMDAGGDALTALGRPVGGVLGFFAGEDPAGSLRGAVEGVRDPEWGARQGRNIGGVRLLPDEDIWGQTRFLPDNVSPRDIGGAAAVAVLDPLNIAAPGAATVGRSALRTGAREAGEEVAEAVVRPPTVQKVIDLLNEAKPLVGETAKLQHSARSAQARALSGLQGKGGGEAGLRAQMGALKGELPRADFTEIRPQFAQGEVDELIDMVEGAGNLRPFDKVSANAALLDALHGQLPNRSEIAKLEKVFGTDFARALLSNRTAKQKAIQWAFDASGVPKALRASLDISYPFRQGAVLVSRPQFWRAWKPMFQSFGDKKFSAAFNDELTAIPETLSDAAKIGREKVDITSFQRVGQGLTSREEGFQSEIAENLPVIGRMVAASDRAFTTFGNALRTKTYDAVAARWDAAGNVPSQQYDEFAEWLNIATGRARLSKKAAESDLLVAANRLFFSPRFTLSRFQTIEEAGKTVAAGARAGASKVGAGGYEMGAARKEIARDLVGFVSTGSAALGILGAFGWAKINGDLESPDLGKARIGNTRYDFWGGNQQAARYILKMIGDAADLDPQKAGKDTLRFARGRLDPGLPALVVDVASGRTFLGDKVDGSPESIARQGTRFIPLSVEDIYDAIKDSGLFGVVKAAPTIVGIGSSTYTTLEDARNEATERLFPGRAFEELNQGQRKLVNEDKAVQGKVGDLNPDYGSVQQQAAAAFDRLRQVNEQAEASLRTRLDAGVSGEDRRRAISAMKQDRFKAGEALISPEVEASLKASDKPEDIFAERYWSADAPQDPLTGRVDFNVIDQQRQAILAEAQAAGVDPEYILGNDAGTFRGTRFKDEKVREAVNSYEDFQRRLNERGFFALDEQTWATVKARLQGPMGADAQGFASFEEYRDEVTKGLAERLQASGMDEGIAQQRAETAISSQPVVKGYMETLRMARFQWLRGNTDLAERTIADGYISPSAANVYGATGLPAGGAPRKSSKPRLGQSSALSGSPVGAGSGLLR